MSLPKYQATTAVISQYKNVYISIKGFSPSPSALAFMEKSRGCAISGARCSPSAIRVLSSPRTHLRAPCRYRAVPQFESDAGSIRALTRLQTQENLLFAIPKKGRLHDKIVRLLEGAGLSYYRVRGPAFDRCCLGRSVADDWMDA